MISTVLHPAHKTEYFAAVNWPEEWIDTAVSLVKDEFTRKYSEAQDDDDVIEVSAPAIENKVRVLRGLQVREDLT